MKVEIKKIFRFDFFKLIVLLAWTGLFIWFLGQCAITGPGPQPSFIECFLMLRNFQFYLLYVGILIGLYFVTALLTWIYYKLKK